MTWRSQYSEGSDADGAEETTGMLRWRPPRITCPRGRPRMPRRDNRRFDADRILIALTLLCLALPARAGNPKAESRKPGSRSPVSFINDVVPVLTKAGCNAGACHGSQYGKGGFKLSLLGYDPEVDYAALVRQFAARRVSLGNPPQSLILRKPSMKLPHGGGLRFKPGSFEYRTL